MFKQCAFPRCPELITEGKYCPRHKPNQPTFNTSKEQHSHYTSLSHKQWREYILMQDPLCKECERQGKLVPATVAHHINNDWRDNRLENGEGLCAACHTPTFHKEEKECLKKAI